MADKTIQVLLVEDSPTDAMIVREELTQVTGVNFVLTHVERLSEALQRFKEQSFDVVLLDLNLPDSDGLETITRLRKAAADIPVVILSGRADETLAMEAVQSGAQDYLVKGHLGERVLARAVRYAIERRRSDLERERFFTLSPDLLCIAGFDGYFKHLNPAFKATLGFTDVELCQKPLIEFVHPDDRAATVEELARIGAGAITLNFQNRYRCKDGSYRWLSWTASPFAQEGTLYAAGRDITERKRTEAAFRASEERFRQIAENIHEVFWMTDAEKSAILYVSPAYEEIWGRTCKSLYDSPGDWMKSIHPEDRDRVGNAWTMKQPGVNYDETYRIVRPDGEIRWIRDRAFPILDPLGRSHRIVGTAEDFTEYRQLEEQFRQTQKMEAIGQLAGGVAHDFNNILAVIQMQADQLMIGENLSPMHREFAADIAAATRRAAALTRQLLLFSRKQNIQQSDLDLNQSINSMMKMLKRTIGEDIQIQFKFAMQPLFIHADGGMLDQVLMNLVVNARDAMPKGGKLVIETSGIEIDKLAASQLEQTRLGSFVCLSVSDTGCGISSEHLSRIFEPFFTTKDVGKGTGLGLATVFGIIQQHQGWIKVYSEAGRGTTFRIYLPRLANLSGKKSHETTFKTLPGGNETILFAEDDAFLRSSVRMALSRLGYRVLEAVNGVEALEIWKQYRDEIHLLLTDMIMPGGMTGKDLGEQLLKDDPKLKVIYASGYSAETAIRGLALEEGVNFLTKPFQAAKLAQTIRSCLDAKVPVTSNLHGNSGEKMALNGHASAINIVDTAGRK